ncbi:MAG: SusE domain-containing protein [Bacteroidota bacterium]
MRRERLPVPKILLLILVPMLFVACQKSIQEPSPLQHNQVQSFHISTSKLVLLQGNESLIAITFSWAGSINAGVKYIVEADVSGSSFSDPIELVSTDKTSASFTVKEFNSLMSKLLYANNTARVEFRIKEDAPMHTKENPVYSSSVGVDVTTYRNYVTYDEQKIIKVPGNYQEWNLTTAPKIIATDDPEEYEGYINFTNQYPQLLMVKGSEWQAVTTYSYIGADKFGFGGSVLSVFGGAGAYLFKANINTHKWSYTKINCWGLSGTAVQIGSHGDPEMSASETTLVWSITTNLLKGSFRIRANNSNAISFGQKACDEPGVPSYCGDNIVIKQAGNYTIKLELQAAGNYAYSLLKNS